MPMDFCRLSHGRGVLASELNYREFSPELLLKPEVSVYFGSYYLGKLLEKFQGQSSWLQP